MARRELRCKLIQFRNAEGSEHAPIVTSRYTATTPASTFSAAIAPGAAAIVGVEFDGLKQTLTSESMTAPQYWAALAAKADLVTTGPLPLSATDCLLNRGA